MALIKMIQESVPTPWERNHLTPENGWARMVKIVPWNNPMHLNYPDYEVGKIYRYNGTVKMCGSGFHASDTFVQCSKYHSLDEKHRYLTVRLKIVDSSKNDKAVGGEIFVEEEEPYENVLESINGRFIIGDAESIEWYKKGKLHRDGDKPAIICHDGTRKWYKNGKLHRDGDEPAVIHHDGTKEWYKNGKLHRDGDEPAMIRPFGMKIWAKFGEYYIIEMATNQL